MTELLVTGPDAATTHLILAHGAGAQMTSPFMEAMAALIGERGIGVTRFEFGYMAARRTGGKRRPPPRAELVLDEYRAVVRDVAAAHTCGTLLIGGKSMGGRVASMIAGELRAAGAIAGAVCLGYPFHPPEKPEQLRTAHLKDLACPLLIVQGERDPFGARAEVEALQAAGALSDRIEVRWASDGDHDLGPRGASGFTRTGNLAAAADAIAMFAAGL